MVSSYWSISSTSSSSSSSSSLLLEGGASVSYIGNWKITICTLNAAPPTITPATLLEYIYKTKTERTRVTGFCLGSSSPSSSNRSPPLVAAVGAGLSVLVGVVVSTGTGGGSGSSGSRVGGSLSVCVRLVDAGGASLSSSSPKRSSFGKKRSCGWHAHFCSRASQRFSPYLSFPFAPLSLAPARPAKACQICCLLIVPRLLEEEDCLPHREAEVRRPSWCSWDHVMCTWYGQLKLFMNHVVLLWACLVTVLLLLLMQKGRFSLYFFLCQKNQKHFYNKETLFVH